MTHKQEAIVTPQQKSIVTHDQKPIAVCIQNIYASPTSSISLGYLQSTKVLEEIIEFFIVTIQMDHSDITLTCYQEYLTLYAYR